MAFENAIITKEDDEKYGLSKIFYQYSPYYEDPTKYWVVDRQRKCWFMLIKRFPSEEYDNGYGSKKLWRLYYNGDSVNIILDYKYDQKINGKLFERVWVILGFEAIEVKVLEDSDIVSLLEEILIKFHFKPYWESQDNFTVTLIDARR
ncbi:hypothetical protein [uncultured Campylobacter sp.]|uniref:hypothetical protein n=1 Tax=uncultured Campylobacter sp. TaxID=218934 RepID=UPI00261A84EC|nr:hypothetical protein [uncultured Campylobacter sp.]